MKPLDQMSEGELRRELLDCKRDPVRTAVITRYLNHLTRTTSRAPAPSPIEVGPTAPLESELWDAEFGSDEQLLDEIFDDTSIDSDGSDFGDLSFLDEFLEEETHRSSPRPTKPTPKPNQYQTAVARDHLNNHLMSRMNSDIDIHRAQRKKVTFVPPFIDQKSSDYASLDEIETAPADDFSNDRLLRAAQTTRR